MMRSFFFVLAFLGSASLSQAAPGAHLCEDLLRTSAQPAQHSSPRISPHSAQTWSHMAAVMGRALQSEMARLETLAPALKTLPNLNYLKSLGLIDSAAPAEVVALEVMDYFSQRKAEAFQKGLLHASESIEPGFLFFNSAKQTLVLPFGAPIPEGYFPALEEGQLYDGTHFTEILGQGYQILQLDAEKGWIALHDVAHLIGYHSNFEYMKAVRRQAQRGAQERLYPTVWSQRASNFYLFELFAWPSRAAFQQFESRFGLEGLSHCQDLKCIQSFLFEGELPKKEVTTYLAANFNSMLQPLGGTLLGANRTRFLGQEEIDSAPYFLMHKLLTSGLVDRYVEMLLLMLRTPLEEHAEMLRKGPSAAFCNFHRHFIEMSWSWERLCTSPL